MPGASVSRLRKWATSLPSVTETTNSRSALPSWQVSRKTFLGVGPDPGSATFHIGEPSAKAVAATHPEYARLVYSANARPAYLGLVVRLRSVSGARLYLWVLEAWAATAPKKVVRIYLDQGGRVPKPMRHSRAR